MTCTRAVAMMVGIALALAGCGGSHASSRHNRHRTNRARSGTAAAGVTATAPHPDLGPFAGYVWNGDVHSVHAGWTVPRVLPGSAQSEAATWIGAEAPGQTGHSPFIQVGVNEGSTDGTPFYYAFYSTTKLHFHPVHLFNVTPGDEVSATLIRRSGHWQIAFVDRSLGRERLLSVTDGARRRFNEAQYTQEDVTNSRTARPFPYPSLSPIRFTGVAANGATPRPSRLTTAWLTEPDGYLAPAPFHDGSFALAHTQMNAAGVRYLRAIAAQDDASATAIDQLLRWAQGGPARPARAAARHFAGVLRATVSVLDHEQWPPAGRPAVSALRRHARRLIAMLSTLKSTTPAGRFAWAQGFYRLAEMVSTDGQTARRALRLPSPLVSRSG